MESWSYRINICHDGPCALSGGTVDVDDIERVMYYREACDKLLGLGTSHGKAAVGMHKLRAKL